MGRMHILLVDEEEELVSTMVRRLRLRGISAEYVTSSEKALDLVQNRDFDLVVMDLSMPGITGIDLMKMIRKINNDIKFIFLTGYGYYNKEMPEIKEGAADCLLKPVNIDALIKRMEEIIS